MNYPEWWGQVEAELNQLIAEFANSIKGKLQSLSPETIIRRKNPYLFCLRATNDVEQFSTSILDAFLSSSEETMFGDLVEKCAIKICNHAKNGIKSTAEGIDIEYTSGDTRTIVQVKSGKNWGNSSQRKKMKDYFTKARRILQQGGDVHVRCIEGICSGKAIKRDMGNYYTYVGSDFWEEISDWSDTYTALLYIFSEHAENGFQELKQKANYAITEFLVKNGISLSGQINWLNLVRYVNGK